MEFVVFSALPHTFDYEKDITISFFRNLKAVRFFIISYSDCCQETNYSTWQIPLKFNLWKDVSKDHMLHLIRKCLETT